MYVEFSMFLSMLRSQKVKPITGKELFNNFFEIEDKKISKDRQIKYLMYDAINKIQ